VRDDRKSRVVSVLRQAQQGFPKLSRRLKLRLYNIKPPQPKKDRDQL
jgi:hypothetical protein